MIRFALIVTMTATLGAAPLAAQGLQGRGPVPAGHMPPPGMCRVWIDGVPPGQQPAPTDCASAVRNRPANGRVIFGEDVRRKKFKGKTAAASLGDRYNDKRTRRADGRYDREDGRYDRDARGQQAASNLCEDRDRDGRCDDAPRSTLCVDQDRDGYCDDKLRVRESSGTVDRDGKRRRVRP